LATSGLRAIGAGAAADYFFNEGYWGASIGFYGGIDYGFGYFGNGYEGGRWQNGHFFYNTAVNRVEGNSFRNVYNERVNDSANGKLQRRQRRHQRARTASEQTAARRPHGPVSAQTHMPSPLRTIPNSGFPRITAHAGFRDARANTRFIPRNCARPTPASRKPETPG